MKRRLALFSWIYVIAMCNFAYIASEVPVNDEKDSKTNCIKLYEKIDFLIEKVEKLETNRLTSCGSEDKNKLSIAQILSAFEGHFTKTDKIEKLAHQFIDQCSTSGTKNSIVSQLISMCESKINIWAKEVNDQFKGDLKKLEMCANDQKTLNLCKPNPCLNGGRCVLSSSGSDYLCSHCPYPTSGKNCEHVNCEKANKCIQRHDMVYVVFETHMPWIQAYQKCVSEGMGLIMPKDKDSNDYIINELRSIYGSNEKIRYFWSGLKYHEGDKQ